MTKSTMAPQERGERQISHVLQFRPTDSRQAQVRKLSSSLLHLSGKLERIAKRRERIALESPELSPEALFKRVRERRGAVRKALAELRRAEAEPRRSGRDGSTRIVSLGPMDPSARRQEVASGYEKQAREEFDRCDTSEPCFPLPGQAAFYACALGTTSAAYNTLGTGGSCGQETMGCGPVGMDLAYSSMMWLDDQASWLANDEPDRAMWFDSSCAFLPCMACDATVFATFHVQVETEALLEADDANTVRHELYVAHSDPDGALPQYVTFGDHYEVVSERTVSQGEWARSGSIEVVVAFPVKAGVSPVIAIATGTQLSAQDGTLQVAANWLVRSVSYLISPRSVSGPVTYQIDVKTGTVEHAATNAAVRIQLFGNFGESPPLVLNNPGTNDFKAGALDKFTLALDRDLGNISKVRVWHDNSGEGPGWYLEYVLVRNLTRRIVDGFHCYRWLAVNKDDGRIDRILDRYPP